jgi:hypothetical protein
MDEMGVEWDIASVIYRCQRGGKYVLYKTLNEFCTRMKQVGLIKMC